MTSSLLTEDLCRFAAGIRFADLPDAAIGRAEAAIADTIGCIIGGIGASSVRPVLELALDDGGSEQSTILGTRHRLPATAAALVNGMAGHALDFDDISGEMYGHPSVVLVPSLFAVGERIAARGDAVIAAYVAGFEVAAAIGRQVNPAHYDQGWHATSTIGSLAAAAAVSRLLDLPAGQIQHALGIAASQAAGMHRQFGTDVKPMHAGLAARAGVHAAMLAARGMTGARAVLDGKGGFADVYGGGSAVMAPAAAPAALASAGARVDDLALIRSGIQVKRHSCCAATHTSIDAMLELVDVHGIVGGEIESVECRVNAVAGNVLKYPVAHTPGEAKFSLPFCVAVAALHGDCGIARFTQATVDDGRVRDLASRIALVVDPAMPAVGTTASRTSIRMRDGRVLAAEVATPKGSPQRPLAVDELRRKFVECAGARLQPSHAVALFDRLLALRDAPDVREIALETCPRSSERGTSRRPPSSHDPLQAERHGS